MMEFKNNKFIYTTDALMSNPEIKSFYILFTQPAGKRHSGFITGNNRDTDSVCFLWSLSKEKRISLGDGVSVLQFSRADGDWAVTSFD